MHESYIIYTVDGCILFRGLHKIYQYMGRGKGAGGARGTFRPEAIVVFLPSEAIVNALCKRCAHFHSGHALACISPVSTALPAFIRLSQSSG